MIRKTIVMNVLIAALGTAFAARADGDWKKQLEQRLEESFPLTKIGYKRSVKNAGALVILKKDGVRADLQDKLTLPTNIFQDGRFSIGGALLSSVEGGDARTLSAGQKLFVQNIGVKENEVKFIVFTADQKEKSILGTTSATFMKAAIAFRFRGGSLESTDYATLMKTINEVLATEESLSAPKKIELGQSMSHVEEALGKPEKIVNLGPKTIYAYKDIRVIFVDGKVADVQ